MILGKQTKILLFDGSFKYVEDIDIDDLIVSPSGNIVKIKSVLPRKQELMKINIRCGRPIVCGEDTKFLTLNKNNCRRPTKELENAKIIEGVVNKGYYLINPKIDQVNNFFISKEQAWLLGLFASNGRFKYRYKNVSSLTIFSIYQDEVIKMLKNSFPAASVRKDKKIIGVSGKSVIDFFMSYVPEATKLSPEIVWMSKDLQLEFLKGWFSNKSSYTDFNSIIGSTKHTSIAEAIIFILSRLEILYSITEGINSRIVINGDGKNKIYHMFLKENSSNKDTKDSYRNFKGNLLYLVKNVERIYDECFELEIDDGIVANGYAIKSNDNKNYIDVFSMCEKCKEIIKLSNNSICCECRKKEIVKPSWRYKLKCQKCGKEIKNKTGNKKFCSDACRRKNYNPLNFSNQASDKYSGYVNKGFVSYPQQFIYEIIKNNYNFDWTFNNRTIIRNPNTNYPLELDIYCEKLNFAIEYDGKGHFEDDKRKNLKYVKYMDKLKNKLCEENNIKLLRIAYFDDWKNKDWIIKKVGELINGDN